MPRARPVFTVPDAGTMPDGRHITPNYIVDLYERNELAADARFKGKRIVLWGRVSEVKRGIGGAPYIIFHKHGIRSVQAFFEENDVAELSRLVPGIPIAIVGICRGLMLNVILTDSIILA